MAELPSPLLEVLRAARLLVLDVDGTLTDGAVVYVGDKAVEAQRFCVRDGQGLVLLRRAGVRVAWITGRGCAATERRAEELGVDALRTHIGPKAEALAEVQAELGVEPAHTLAMGDDLPDLALRAGAAAFLCPPEAVPEVRERADLVTTASAGHGAVREVCDAVLRARGDWDAILERVGG